MQRPARWPQAAHGHSGEQQKNPLDTRGQSGARGGAGHSDQCDRVQAKRPQVTSGLRWQKPGWRSARNWPQVPSRFSFPFLFAEGRELAGQDLGGGSQDPRPPNAGPWATVQGVWGPLHTQGRHPAPIPGGLQACWGRFPTLAGFRAETSGNPATCFKPISPPSPLVTLSTSPLSTMNLRQ